MDIPIVLSGIGMALGALSAVYTAVTSNSNKRFELITNVQGETIIEVKKDRDDLRNRVSVLEQANLDTQKELMACERRAHRMEMKIDELLRLVPNGTAIDFDTP